MEGLLMRFELRVDCNHKETHTLIVPLLLKGTESREEALSRLEDAWVVVKHKMRDHHSNGEWFPMIMAPLDGEVIRVKSDNPKKDPITVRFRDGKWRPVDLRDCPLEFGLEAYVEVCDKFVWQPLGYCEPGPSPTHDVPATALRTIPEDRRWP
jgi:hypothetical protein